MPARLSPTADPGDQVFPPASSRRLNKPRHVDRSFAPRAAVDGEDTDSPALATAAASAMNAADGRQAELDLPEDASQQDRQAAQHPSPHGSSNRQGRNLGHKNSSGGSQQGVLVDRSSI